MDDLDGTGQETPRAHAAPPRRSGVDRLSVRSTDCSARDNALSGTAMQKRRNPRMPVAARPGIFVHFSHVMNTTHNCSSRNSWPQTLLSHTSHTAPARPHRAHTVAERGIERLTPGCDARGHARSPRPGTRSAGPVWTHCRDSGVPTRQRPRPPRPRLDRRHGPYRPGRAAPAHPSVGPTGLCPG